MNTEYKKVWITGASSGIGRELSLKFATNGWKVAASARRENLLKNLNELNKNIKAFPLDITNNESAKDTFKKIIETFGDLDVCVFNSGIYLRNEEKINIDTIKKVFETNFFGTLNCIDSVSEFFKIRKKGHISIMGSTAGYRGLSSISGYGASKAALINLTESLYLMMSNYNVKVTLINPGFVKSSITDKNTFKMPFLVKTEDAASKIYNEIIKEKKFEIAFPRIYIYLSKIVKIMPYKIYFPFIAKKIMYKLFNIMKKK